MALSLAYGASIQFANPTATAYITTNPDIPIPLNDSAPDGSIRIIHTPGEDIVHIEKKTSGVWNDTGFRFSSASVSLGRDLRIGAAGGFVETFNVSEIDDHVRALLPHIQFDALGTTKAAHMPILDKRGDIIVFPGPATGEIVAKTIGQSFVASPARLLHSATHTTGTVAATSEIQISYYKGVDNTGSILNRFNIPSSIMPASTTFTITYIDDFGFENATNIFFEFASAENISLVTNTSGQVITTQNGHILDELDIILDELVLANDLSLTFSNDLGFAVRNRF